MAVDEGVGRILAALESAGQLDNTLIVFTSDHGYFYGEHGLSVERRLAYEETIRIPLLMRYPQLIKAGHHAGADGAEHRPGAHAAGLGRRRRARGPARPIARAAARGTHAALARARS